MKKQLVLLIAAVGICASSVSSAWSYDTREPRKIGIFGSYCFVTD